MTVAVLPFNAGPDAPPALARQIANFACDIVRNNTGKEVNPVNYMIRVSEQPPRFANVNAAEVLNEPDMINQFFDQAGADVCVDGLLTKSDSGLKLHVRSFRNGSETPQREAEFDLGGTALFQGVRGVVDLVASNAEAALPEELNSDENLFGTQNHEAFLLFLEAFDALQYIEKTQGQVAEEFSPTPSMDKLIEAARLDPDWEAPYLTLVQLSRACSNFQIGNPMEIEERLRNVIATAPEDGRGHFALGELLQSMGRLEDAANSFEKASAIEPEEPAIVTRLGIVQLQLGMPVNAERNFRKAIEMEGDDKPSMDFLAEVLGQTNRAHEIPALWQSLIDANPQNGAAHAKLGIAHINAGQEDQAIRAFDIGLETLEDNTIVKRYYAPVLAQKGEFDRAMDFYEDCLDVAPNDIPLLIEYARTLDAAGREFEIPNVLKNVMQSNPDPNTAAQTQEWLTRLEQPKRVETVENAKKLFEENDYEGALRLLKPMKNWLSDYWPMWLVTAAASNRLELWEDAQDAATRLVNLFPGCEPAYAELAAALGGQDKHDEAYNMLRFANAQVPNSLTIVLNLAQAAKKSGRGEESKAIIKQIREASGPDNAELENILAAIERD